MAKAVKKKEVFELGESMAQTVHLVGDFTDWDKKPIQMKKQKNGVWKTTVSLKPGRYHYRYLVDGEWRNDPCSTSQAENPFGSTNSVRDVQ